MSTIPVPREERLDRLPIHLNDVRDPGYWGMLGLIATEAMLFACLLASLYYLRSTMGIDTADRVHPPKLELPLLNTLLLVSSSVAYWWAEHGIRKDELRRFQLGAGLTLLLGIAFLAVQGIEYSKKPAPTSDAYHSLFFAITGMHGLHVFLGLVLIAVTLVRASVGRQNARQHLATKNVGLYWHFVDAVWLTIFTTVYLWPHLY